MSEVDDLTLRRLRMRSMRRGIKEMDLILGAYSETRLPDLDAETVALYEEMLFENDQELYQWVSGQTVPPERFRRLIDDIASQVSANMTKNGPH